MRATEVTPCTEGDQGMPREESEYCAGPEAFADECIPSWRFGFLCRWYNEMPAQAHYGIRLCVAYSVEAVKPICWLSIAQARSNSSQFLKHRLLFLVHESGRKTLNDHHLLLR